MPFIPPNTGAFGEFGWSGIMRAAAVIFFAYIGFDAVSTAAQEAKKPAARHAHRHHRIAGRLHRALYRCFRDVLTGMVPLQHVPRRCRAGGHGDRSSSLRVAADGHRTSASSRATRSVILVMLLGQSRVFYSMSRDGLLPAGLLGHPSEVPDAVALAT